MSESQNKIENFNISNFDKNINEYEYMIKISIFGPGEGGGTTFINRLFGRKFKDREFSMTPNEEDHCLYCEFEYNEQVYKCKIIITDVPGQEICTNIASISNYANNICIIKDNPNHSVKIEVLQKFYEMIKIGANLKNNQLHYMQTHRESRTDEATYGGKFRFETFPDIIKKDYPDAICNQIDSKIHFDPRNYLESVLNAFMKNSGMQEAKKKYSKQETDLNEFLIKQEFKSIDQNTFYKFYLEQLNINSKYDYRFEVAKFLEYLTCIDTVVLMPKNGNIILNSKIRAQAMGTIIGCHASTLNKIHFNKSDGTMSTNKFNNIYTTTYGFSSKEIEIIKNLHKTHNLAYELSNVDEPQMCFPSIYLDEYRATTLEFTDEEKWEDYILNYLKMKNPNNKINNKIFDGVFKISVNETSAYIFPRIISILNKSCVHVNKNMFILQIGTSYCLVIERMDSSSIFVAQIGDNNMAFNNFIFHFKEHMSEQLGCQILRDYRIYGPDQIIYAAKNDKYNELYEEIKSYYNTIDAYVINILIALDCDAMSYEIFKNILKINGSEYDPNNDPNNESTLKYYAMRKNENYDSIQINLIKLYTYLYSCHIENIKLKKWLPVIKTKINNFLIEKIKAENEERKLMLTYNEIENFVKTNCVRHIFQFSQYDYDYDDFDNLLLHNSMHNFLLFNSKEINLLLEISLYCKEYIEPSNMYVDIKKINNYLNKIISIFNEYCLQIENLNEFWIMFTDSNNRDYLVPVEQSITCWSILWNNKIELSYFELIEPKTNYQTILAGKFVWELTKKILLKGLGVKDNKKITNEKIKLTGFDVKKTFGNSDLINEIKTKNKKFSHRFIH